MTVGLNGVQLKGATRLLIRDVGTVEAAAAICQVGHSIVGRYQHVDAPEFITIDKVAVLESQDGVYPHVTQALAAAAGHILVARPKVPADGIAAAHLAAVAKEAGDVLSRFGTSLAGDGAIDAGEARKLIAEVDQALGALTALRAWLDGITAPGIRLAAEGPR